jgi:hypothetical protein
VVGLVVEIDPIFASSVSTLLDDVVTAGQRVLPPTVCVLKPAFIGILRNTHAPAVGDCLVVVACSFQHGDTSVTSWATTVIDQQGDKKSGGKEDEKPGARKLPTWPVSVNVNGLRNSPPIDSR